MGIDTVEVAMFGQPWLGEKNHMVAGEGNGAVEICVRIARCRPSPKNVGG